MTSIGISTAWDRQPSSERNLYACVAGHAQGPEHRSLEHVVSWGVCTECNAMDPPTSSMNSASYQGISVFCDRARTLQPSPSGKDKSNFSPKAETCTVRSF
ncbi:hypothetical protein N7468_010166 [Penicillium chermesinum]|uniref:Uncharacterized protein n=1 Tax=Penicillium chermesinum TaxID=63820 RepID=A0A9W9TC07_9EURO|nr:uncharacterized protein N7468_010166 [Penicillium chermesinum]KAJ5217158.1 hypothetical protein N7468_010166 [Penicillium chermesinum]